MLGRLNEDSELPLPSADVSHTMYRWRLKVGKSSFIWFSLLFELLKESCPFKTFFLFPKKLHIIHILSTREHTIPSCPFNGKPRQHDANLSAGFSTDLEPSTEPLEDLSVLTDLMWLEWCESYCSVAEQWWATIRAWWAIERTEDSSDEYKEQPKGAFI